MENDHRSRNLNDIEMKCEGRVMIFTQICEREVIRLALEVRRSEVTMFVHLGAW